MIRIPYINGSVSVKKVIRIRQKSYPYHLLPTSLTNIRTFAHSEYADRNF